MATAILVISANQQARKDFGGLLDRKNVGNQLPFHTELNRRDIFLTEPSDDTIGNVRLMLDLGIDLPCGAEPGTTFAIVDETVLQEPYIKIHRAVDERIIIVSPNGKVTVLSEVPLSSEAA